MDYIKLIKNAFQITWRNKFLWIFGLFAGGGGIGWSWNNLNYQFNTDDSKETLSFAQFNQIKSWFYQHETVIYIILGLLILLFLFFWIFSIISQGAIIGGVAKISQEEKMNFKSTFLIGWRNFWRVLGLDIIILFLLFFILVILALPVIVLAVTGLTVLAIIIGIIFGLSYTLFIILSSFVFAYTYRILIIEKTGIFSSLSLAYHFFFKHWKKVLVIWLINLGLGAGWGLAIVLTMLILGGTLFAFGLAIYFLSKIALIIYALLFGLALIIFLIIVLAGFRTFISSIWTLSYLELKNIKN